MLHKTDREKGVFALIAVALIMSSMGLFARALNTTFTPLQQVYLRIGTALILGTLLFYRDLNFSKLVKIPKREWFILFVRSIATYLLGVTLFSKAVTIAKISTVAFVSALPFVAILGFIFLKEKITFQKIIYLLLGFVGVLLISVKDYSHLFSWGTGELAAFVSSFFLSLGFVLRRNHSNLLNNQEISILIFFISTILLIGTSLALHEHIPPPATWPIFIVLVIIGAGLANIAYLFLSNYGFHKIEAVLGNNLLMLAPLFAIVFGFLFYKELPSLKEFIGGILVITSAYRMNKNVV